MKKIKRVLCLLLTVSCISFALTGCVVNNTDREELQRYCDNDLHRLAETEKTILTDFNKAVKLYNSGSKKAATDVIRDVVLPEAKAWQNDAQSIEINNAELKSIHQIYIDYASDYMVSLNYFAKGMDEQNKSQIDNAMAKVNACNEKVAEYKQKMIDFGKANKIDITFIQ